MAGSWVYGTGLVTWRRLDTFWRQALLQQGAASTLVDGKGCAALEVATATT
jgi:hypothetical protein